MWSYGSSGSSKHLVNSLRTFEKDQAPNLSMVDEMGQRVNVTTSTRDTEPNFVNGERYFQVPGCSQAASTPTANAHACSRHGRPGVSCFTCAGSSSNPSPRPCTTATGTTTIKSTFRWEKCIEIATPYLHSPGLANNRMKWQCSKVNGQLLLPLTTFYHVV